MAVKAIYIHMEAISLHNRAIFNQPNYRISKKSISKKHSNFFLCNQIYTIPLYNFSLIKKIITYIYWNIPTHTHTHTKKTIISVYYIKVLLTKITKQNRKTATQNYRSLFGIVMPLPKLTKTKNC